MKNKNTFIFIFLAFILSTSTNILTQNKNDFAPLEVGNKWFYTNHIDSISYIKEVISRDTISGKEYYKIKNTRSVFDSLVTTFHHERVFNDTLFIREYSTLKNQITDRVVAIFSLFPGQSHVTLKVQGEWEEKWTILDALKMTQRKANYIEFQHGLSPATDHGSYTAYKKGIGLIRSKSVQGRGIWLVKHHLN
jgi:hypothetical protein